MDTHCPLCAHALDMAHAHCLSGCPMGGGCNLVRCPNCGYEMPGETRLTRFLSRWFKGGGGEQQLVSPRPRGARQDKTNAGFQPDAVAGGPRLRRDPSESC